MIFKEIHPFYTPNDLPFGWKVMKTTISCHFTLKMLHAKFSKDLLRSSWEYVIGRRTTGDDGSQPIAIGHLSDSGYLKMHTMCWRAWGRGAVTIDFIHRSVTTGHWTLISCMRCECSLNWGTTVDLSFWLNYSKKNSSMYNDVINIDIL